VTGALRAVAPGSADLMAAELFDVLGREARFVLTGGAGFGGKILFVSGYQSASRTAEIRRMIIDLRSINDFLLIVILILLVICLRD
jgi:hypothetical protein